MMISIMPFAFVLFVLFICGLVGAASSGRVWSALAGLFGTLLVIGGGLLLLGFFWLTPRTVGFQNSATYGGGGSGHVELRRTVKVEESRPPAPPQLAEAPELFASSDVTSQSGQRAQASDASFIPSRPSWMDGPQGLSGDVYRTVVTVGPWLTRAECEQQLPEELRRAVRTYADRLLGEGMGQYVNLDMAYIHNHIVRGECEEHRQQTIEKMIYLHELLQFDREANDAIEASYKQSVVAGRLGYTAAGGGGVLALLAVLFGYFKLDTLTRGYYTGRLRLTAATAILALAAIAGLLVLA